MKPTLATHRAYFFVVLWFTLWVGFFGFFRPDLILKALSWPVPPLHARFIGSLYLAATVFLGLSLFSRSLLAVRTIVHIAFWWTGWLLVVTFMHWDTFDFARPQPWFWVVAYVLFPLTAGWLALRTDYPQPSAGEGILEGWVLWVFRTEALLFGTFAVLLFVAPSWVANVWPWKISPFLAQIYSGPLLGLGIGAWMLARRRNWTEARIPTVGLLVFSVLALVASLVHRASFVAGSPSATVWFATFGLLAVVSAVLLWKGRTA